MKTIAIANQKGGTGKTTTAYNLGIALTQQGYRVLMVDFDPQGNLSCYCGIPPEQDLEQTITELLMKVAYEKPLSHRECVYQSKRTDDSAPQVDFIPSNLRLASFELAMGTMMCREVLLKTCLEQYSSQYDYCIIDCSPSVGLLLTNALSAANEVIIPMQAQPFSVVGMSQLTNSISSVQRKINPRLHIRGVLLTMTQHTKVSEHYALTVYTWWDVTKFEHLQKMKSDFEAENPDIKLEFVTIPSKYADTMITKLAAGEIPDVMMLAMDQVPRYALNGMLMPLDDLASQEYKDSLYPVVTEALTVNGTMYAAARDITPKVMYINTKMFKDAGVEIPAEDWTMDDFVEVAKQLTKGSGADAQWGYYWKNYTDQTFAMIAAFGGKLYSEDGKASVLSTDPKTKEAVQFMYDLCNTYKVCPTATQAAQFGDNEFAPFMANKVAMQIGALSTASNMDANGTEYTVLPMPSIDGVSKTSSFVNTWVIPKTAKNPDLSWRVVEFLSGKEGQQIALDMNFGLPASKLVDTTAFEAKAPYNKYFVEALETAVPYPTNLNGSAFQTMFQKECESLWAGAITPEEFETRVDEQAAEILNK